jgi:mRNA degradation ribonuclease J1/J2
VVDVDTGELVGPPTFQHRGIHAKPEAIAGLSEFIADGLSTFSRDDLKDVDRVRFDVADLAKRHLHKKAGIRPVIVPIVVEV